MARISWKCPNCGDRMAVTGLQCISCGAEVSGQFAPCRFCDLDEGELNLLFAFLAGRGNIKQVEKSLGISYPTVRSRLDTLLDRLGLSADFKPRPMAKDILDRLERGEISVEKALGLLEGKGQVSRAKKRVSGKKVKKIDKKKGEKDERGEKKDSGDAKGGKGKRGGGGKTALSSGKQ